MRFSEEESVGGLLRVVGDDGVVDGADVFLLIGRRFFRLILFWSPESLGRTYRKMKFQDKCIYYGNDYFVQRIAEEMIFNVKNLLTESILEKRFSVVGIWLL